MRVTIIKDDNIVIADGRPHMVNCSDLPADFHALQWDGTSGEVEYSAVLCAHCGVRSKKQNQTITDLAPYQKHIDAWRTMDDAATAALFANTPKVEANAAGPEN